MSPRALGFADLGNSGLLDALCGEVCERGSVCVNSNPSPELGCQSAALASNVHPHIKALLTSDEGKQGKTDSWCVLFILTCFECLIDFFSSSKPEGGWFALSGNEDKLTQVSSGYAGRCCLHANCPQAKAEAGVKP